MGTLIYILVLGLFNDYTSVVEATSFSIVVYASIILELLTYGAFLLKKIVVDKFKNRTGNSQKLLMVFCVWLVLFLSKFVFIGVVNMILGNYINIHGFFGILLIVLSVTVIHQLADKLFTSLGDK